MLPPGYAERAAEPADLAAVAELVIATDVFEFGEPDWTEQDQEAEWSDPRLCLDMDTRVVHAADGRLVGYGYVQQRALGVDFDSDAFVSPDRDDLGLEEHLMAFAERRARELVDPQAARPRLVAVCHAPNTVRAARFRAAGFTPLRHFYRMTAHLPLPEQPLPRPAEVTVRRYADESELATMHAVLTAAFAGHFRSVPQSYDAWRARHGPHEGDRAPWLVAELDGAIVGALVAQGNLPGLGWIASLGVLADARGRGVGLALLRAAIDEFARLDVQRISLGVDAENATGAVQLYEKAGMSVERRFDFYELVLRPV